MKNSRSLAKSLFLFVVFIPMLFFLSSVAIFSYFLSQYSSYGLQRVIPFVFLFGSVVLFLLLLFCYFVLDRKIFSPIEQINEIERLSLLNEKSSDFDDLQGIYVSEKNACEDINYLYSYHRNLVSHLQSRSTQVGKMTEVSRVINRESEELRSKYDTLLYGVIEALKTVNAYNDADTGEHMHRLSLYSNLMGKFVGFSGTYLQEISLFAALHDVGKVGIPDNILKKPGPLTVDEWSVMKKHCHIGYVLAESVGFGEVAKNIILYHHEKWNGQGYPHGLRGTQIPEEARLVAVVDVFDALVSRRVYKDPFSREKVISIIQGGAGVHFDPKYAHTLLNNLDDFYNIFISYNAQYSHAVS